MNAVTYIERNKMLKVIKSLKRELIVCHISTAVMAVVTVASCFSGEWECIAASLLTMSIPLSACMMVRWAIERLEERIFQLRMA
jgi:hypothetical protein